MYKKVALGLTLLLVVLLLVATNAIGLAQSNYTVMIADNAMLGKYLVDGEGKALYYFTRDTTGVSNCKGQCAVIWPPFYANEIKVPTGLDAADFGVITREDGMKQTTYKGMPLYYFNKDMKAGDVNGDKVNNVWFIIPVK